MGVENPNKAISPLNCPTPIKVVNTYSRLECVMITLYLIGSLTTIQQLLGPIQSSYIHSVVIGC